MIGALLIGTTKALIVSLLSEKLILKITLELLRWATQKTTNTIDDTVVALMEERLQETGVI
jgi:hypothetical protein